MRSHALFTLLGVASTGLAQSTTQAPSTTLETITTVTNGEPSTTTRNPNTTIAFFVPESVIGAGTPTVLANVLASDSARTTYSIKCKGGREEGIPCGLIHDAKVTVGTDPRTVDIQASERITSDGPSPKTIRDLSVTAHCEINSGTAICSGTSRNATIVESTADGRVVDSTVTQESRQISTTAASSGGHVIAITIITSRFPEPTTTNTPTGNQGGNGNGSGNGNGNGNGGGNGNGANGPASTSASRAAAPRMTQGAAVVGVVAAVGGFMAML